MKDIDYDYFYEDESDSKYCYPGTNILKNKLNITDLQVLHDAERDFSYQRLTELIIKPPVGDFSLQYLCKIHEYLFQDIYAWAGKIRTVDIAKGTIFCLSLFIVENFNDLYSKLKNENFLKDINTQDEMCERLAYYFGEINMIHPFREGNGRAQRFYIEQLCRAGGRFEISFENVTADEMLEASVASAKGDNNLFKKIFLKCIRIPFDETMKEIVKRQEGIEVFEELRKQVADVPEMSLEEINQEIADTRSARGKV